MAYLPISFGFNTLARAFPIDSEIILNAMDKLCSQNHNKANGNPYAQLSTFTLESIVYFVS